jgi:chromate transporter
MIEPAIEPASAVSAPVKSPTLIELFLAFALCSISGFGGVLPWARRMVVDQKHWMTADEFNEVFSLSQFLPGANVVNFAVVFGSRFGGWTGAVVSVVGLLGPPVAIITVLAVLYARFGDVPTLGRILAGVSAAAAGLLVAMVVKMAMPVLRRGQVWAATLAAVTFVAVGPLHWPLQWVIIVLAPIGVAIAWMRSGTQR